MELIMETNFEKQRRIDRAKKQVKRIKGFYTHLLVYVVINAIILVANFSRTGFGEGTFHWENFSTLIFWGIALLIHAASVFMPNIIFGTEWEDRMIKKYMDKEKQGWK